VAERPAEVRAYRFAGWELNVRLRRLTAPRGDNVPLTNTEFNLLAAFLAAPQRVLSRDQILGLSRLHNDEVYDRSSTRRSAACARNRARRRQGTAHPHRGGTGYVFTASSKIVR